MDTVIARKKMFGNFARVAREEVPVFGKLLLEAARLLVTTGIARWVTGGLWTET